MNQMEHEKIMSRAEWIKQARRECEQSLENTPKKIILESKDKKQEKDRYMKPAKLNSLFEPDEEEMRRKSSFRQSLSKSDSSKIAFAPKEQVHDTETNQELSILRIRFVIAAVIAIGIISVDFFHIKAGPVNSDMIRTCIASNHTIEQIEKTVSDFTKDKILPVFGGEKNEKE